MSGEPLNLPAGAAEAIFANDILFGADEQPGILAVELADDTHVAVYLRGSEMAPVLEPLRPVVWVGAGGSSRTETRKLEGNLGLNHLVECCGWKECLTLQKVLKGSGAPFFSWGDPVQQYLAATGRTLFKGLHFEDLRRMQIDIETDTAEGFDFPHPQRDALAAIAMSDSSGWEQIVMVEIGSPASEKAAIEEVTRLILERNPDVIEGHALFRFDLPYLATRAKIHKIKLAWGRQGEALTSRPSRLQIAERTIQLDRFQAPGRHFVDTWVLAQHYDVGTRELDSFGLKNVARHLGVAEPARVLIEGDKISAAYRSRDDDFVTYALQDVRETRSVAAALSQSYFAQAQIFPFNYQDVILRGNATKIDALLLREYLRRSHSVPLPPAAETFEGGATDIFQTGVLRNVWHCDASSLYPSLMLAFEIAPQSDQLGIFSGLLRDLRRARLDAKRAAREAAEPAQRSRLEALQGTFKILINSFYGYLGFGQGHFADFGAAREVAARGRQILGSMVDWLGQAGANIIEIDTDGIYFLPPEGATRESLSQGMAQILPEGIEVEFAKTYEAMFSYKAKNYALLDSEGRITVKGGALKSRGMEPYLRTFLLGMVRHLLEGHPPKAARLRDQMLEQLRTRQIPIADLARTETLQDSPTAYRRKIAASSRNRSAAFELALRSERDYRAGDQIRYYITGDKRKVTAYLAAKPLHEHDPKAPDENTAYYAAKLEELASKFEAYFPGSDLFA